MLYLSHASCNILFVVTPVLHSGDIQIRVEVHEGVGANFGSSSVHGNEGGDTGAQESENGVGGVTVIMKKIEFRYTGKICIEWPPTRVPKSPRPTLARGWCASR